MLKIRYLIIALLCAVAQGVWAQTEVANESELTSAISGGTTVSVTLTADIALSENLTISSDKTVTIDLNGHKLSRSLSANVNYGMVIYLNGGNLTINDGSGDNRGSIEGGRSYNGAGILCESGSTLTVNGGTFTNNDVSRTESGNQGRGGAIFMNPNTTLTVTGGVFDGNSAYQGGAIYLDDNSTVSGTVATATISGAEFKNCWVTGNGGAIFNKGILSVTNCTFTDNTSTDGGAIYNETGAELTTTGGTYTSNSATEHGGGGVTNYGTLTINGGTFTNNSGVGNGGGIWTNQNISMQGLVTIKDNTGNGGTNNLYLAGKSTKINCGTFTSGSSIGVRLETYKRTFTSGFETNNSSAAATDFFTADIDGITMGKMEGEVIFTYSTTSALYVECSWVWNDENDETEGGHVVKTTKLANNVTNYSGQTSLSDGWYLLRDFNHTNYSNRLVIKGDVKLILQDDCRVEFEEGIHIEKNKTLTIYGQSQGTGILYCTGDDGSASNGDAAIGGNNEVMGGHLVIHGGVIEAEPDHNCAAGIGGGDGNSGMQSITIYGGNITAKGSSSGAGIGGGEHNTTATPVTIYGGTINAYGGQYAAGIGGGEDRTNGTIKIYGGTVNATGGENGAGIGGGEGGGLDNPVTIYGGNVTATGGENGAGIGSGRGADMTAPITIYGGTVNATCENYAAGIGGGYSGAVKGNITIYGGNVTAKCTGEGSSISISDISYGHAAGIGGGRFGDMSESAVISIYGGTVNAQGGEDGAGIGSGYERDQKSTINIYDGTVNVTAGNGGAGIGGGNSGKGGPVNIYGGTVTVNARSGAGIGGGSNADGGTLTISGGIITIKRTEGIGTAIGRGSEDYADGVFNPGSNMKIAYEGSTPVATNERVSTVQKTRENKTIIISPCEHSGATVSQGDEYYHHYTCSYCEGYDEAHTLGDDEKCTVCGRGLPQCTFTFYAANEAGNGYESVATATYYVTETHEFTFPECSNASDNVLFVGWKQADSAPGNIIVSNVNEIESLKQAGDVITVPTESSDRNYYACYIRISLSGSGTQDDPFLISSTADWDELATAVNDGHTFSGLYLKMTDDITVTTMVGGYDKNPFWGTFDGNGHTLTFNYTAEVEGEYNASTVERIAPFRRLVAATIKNLHVDGTIVTAGRYAAGIGGYVRGSSKIENCRSSITIRSSYAGTEGKENAHHGGIIALVPDYPNAKPTIEGCVFDGKILTTGATPSTGCGGLVGLMYKQKLTLTNCLYNPAALAEGERAADCATLYTRDSGTITVTDCYYTEALGTDEQGTKAYTVSSGTEGLTLDYGSASTTYNYDGIKTYSFGLLYGDKLYSSSGQTVTFTAETAEDKTATGVTASTGSLSGNATDGYTLVMESANSSITATISDRVSEALTLYDGTNDPTNTATLKANRKSTFNVTISGRTLWKNGSWNTLCLPFDVTKDQISTDEKLRNCTIMELDVDGWYDGTNVRQNTYADGYHQTGFTSDGTLYLYFYEVDEIEAGKPYIIKWTTTGDPIVDPEFNYSYIQSSSPGTIKSADGTISFTGCFDPVTIGETGNAKHYLYFGAGNNLYYPTATDFKVNSFRAYFQLHGITAGEPSGQQTVRAFSLHFGDDSEQTGIENVQCSMFNVQSNNAWYSLDGRRLSGKPSRAGMYIYNGKKQVIK